MNDSQDDALRSTQRLYARVWRWHFFAALIVIPFALWQACTGVLYLWHRELAAIAYPELVRVAPGTAAVSYEQQLATVLEHQPRERLQSIEISDEPTRSTAFFFADPNGLVYPAFTNPHTGEYLGEVAATSWIRGLSRGLHGGWPINPWGSYLLELGACWAIVMTLTGLYLWWPRNARGFAGVLYPRLGSGSRTFWRDLHATVGVHAAFILLAFLFSALPWTTFWGQQVLGRIETATNQSSPRGFFFVGGGHHGGHTDHMQSGPTPESLTIDQLVAKARAAGAMGAIELKPGSAGGPANLRSDRPRTTDEVWMQLDGQTGAVRIRVAWSDLPPLAKAIALGVNLHEGRYFGRANQIFNTVVATALVWLCVTGFIGWYKRRPAGRIAPPPKRELRYPRAVVAIAVTLLVVMPLLAMSVLMIAIVDAVAGRFLPQSA